MSAFKRLSQLAASVENLGGDAGDTGDVRAVDPTPAQAPEPAPATPGAPTDTTPPASDNIPVTGGEGEGEGTLATSTDDAIDLVSADADEEVVIDEIDQAEGEARLAVEETFNAIDDSARAVEVNEDAVAAAREVAETNPTEAQAILEASNEAIAAMLGTNEFTLKSISLENVTSDRARRTFVNVSMEQAENRSVGIWARVKAFFARIGKFFSELFQRFMKLFDFNGRRLKTLAEKMKGVEGYTGRQVITNRKLAEALSINGKQQNISQIKSYLIGFDKLSDYLKNTSGEMQSIVEKVLSSNPNTEDPLPTHRQIFNALAFKFEGTEIRQSGKTVFHHLGGFSQVWEIEMEEKELSKISYKLERVKYTGSEDVALGSFRDIEDLVTEISDLHEGVIGMLRKTADTYKRYGLLGGAGKSIRAGLNHRESGRNVAVTISQAANGLMRIFDNVRARPINDLIKIYANAERAIILLGVSALKVAEGKPADNLDSARNLNVATESIEGVYDSGELNKARSEGGDDATQDPAANGKQSTFKDPADGGVNEHQEPKGDANPKSVVEEYIDANAGLLAEEAQEVVATVEALDELGEIATEQDQLLSTVQASEGQGGLDEVSSTLMQASLESIDRRLNRLGVDSIAVKIPSLESFGGVMSRRSATHVSVEAIGERVRNLGAQIKAIVIRFVNWLKNIGFKLYAKFRNLDKQAAAIEAKLKDGKQAEGTITDQYVIKAVSSIFGVNKNGILKSLERTATYVNFVADSGAKLSEAIVSYNTNGNYEVVLRAVNDVTSFSGGGEKTSGNNKRFGGIIGNKALEITSSGQSLSVNMVDDEFKVPEQVDVPKIAEAVELVAKLRELFLSNGAVSKNERVSKAIANQMERFAKANPDKEGDKDHAKEVRELAIAISKFVSISFGLNQSAATSVLRYAGKAVDGKVKVEKPADASATAKA